MTSENELDAVRRLVSQFQPWVVNVGHGRDPASVAGAAAFVATWNGRIGTVVSWPAAAASWLRPATRLAGSGADAWVVSDGPDGWDGIGPRLAATPGWSPARTVVFGDVAVGGSPGAGLGDAFDGLQGVRPDGSTWLLRGGETVTT